MLGLSGRSVVSVIGCRNKADLQVFRTGSAVVPGASQVVPWWCSRGLYDAVMRRILQVWWDRGRDTPCGILLVVQLLAILTYPFLEGGPPGGFGHIALSLLGLFVVFLALFVVQKSPSVTWIGIAIAVPVSVLTIADGIFTNDPQMRLWLDIGDVVFYTYTFVGLLLYMFKEAQVTLDHVLAIGATFTVAVWLFAHVYSAVQVVVPGSFIAAIDADQPRTWMELLFLSCTTMTSTGLSDIVPVLPHARAMVMIQQILGMLYLAIVVARIVALSARLRTGKTATAGDGVPQDSHAARPSPVPSKSALEYLPDNPIVW